jgi:hypothetical protein
VLVGTGAESIVTRAEEVLRRPRQRNHAESARFATPFGDGQAAPRCVAAIARLLRVTQPAAV